MNVLVGCEYSGIVSDAFRAAGHVVTSCDLIPAMSAGHHVIGDVRDLLNNGYDLGIFFPPCTYLAKCQIQLLVHESGRLNKCMDAIKFVKQLYYSPIPQICIENPVGVIPRYWKPYDQIISPHLFGSAYRKETCLWLKNLPPLMFTCFNPTFKSVSNHVNGRMSQAEKSKIKSKFFPEIAQAMATQWS